MSSRYRISLSYEDIRQALAAPLPGVAGQRKMTPQPRPGEGERWLQPADCREAGVLLLLYPYSPNGARPTLYLALTRRPEYPGVHSGQISLPGGRREGQESLRTTALRETMEEIGVLPDKVEIIGQLTPLYTPPSNFCIFPFVAYCASHPVFCIDPQEVAELVETSLNHLLDPAAAREEIWHFEQYGPRRVPFFEVNGHKVWGATAMILSEFITLLTNYLLLSRAD